MALNDISVLLVEDDPVFRQLVSSFLLGRGAKVTQAEDGEQGLVCFKQTQFDIILADLSMPRMGGLDMLKEMAKLDPITPSIVISGNQVMADVVEALRLGASDYLVKPVSDLFTIEQAIKQSLLSPTDSLDESALEAISMSELSDNLALLEQNTEAAKSVQQQLFPLSCIEYPKAKVDYSLYLADDVSAYFIDSAQAGSEHLIVYMAHFHPHSNRCAFASVLLRSFVNEKLKAFRNGTSQAVIEPFNMLSYLNDRMAKSGLDIYVDIIYVAIELTQFRAGIAKAGHDLKCYLRNSEGLSPLALADSLQLGMLDWGAPSIQFRSLVAGETLCIATNHESHRGKLLESEFNGVTYNPKFPQGGFLQISV